MKKLSVILFSLAVLNCIAQNNSEKVKLEWAMPNDNTVTGYVLYYKNITNVNYLSTNIAGKFTTNAVLYIAPTELFEAYVTAKNSEGLESDPSNKIRMQNIWVNGAEMSTPIVLKDKGSTNFPGFLFTGGITNGNITGVPPNLNYMATNTIGKDTIIYRSPEKYANQFITNYYTLIRAMNYPPILSLSE
ncbi:MAG TPA: hypothetical protein PKX15_04945 [Bacteroidales bacterium]|nr:hypothetical protein [Bacteroidales bacterium]